MQILVTGYKGFIGSHLYKRLQELGHDVVGYDYDESHGCTPYVAVYDWVIHVGAISSTTERDVDKIFEYNYDFSIRLFRECHKYSVNMQYASSASVYGDQQQFTEDGPVNPQSPYAWSKYLTERALSIENEGRIKLQGFRYFNVYGDGEDHKGEQASVFTKFRDQILYENKIVLFENSQNYKRDFVCVDDVVDVHLQMLKCNESGVFNVGTGVATSFQQVGDLYSESFDTPIEYIAMPDNLKHQYQSYTCADNRKINNLVKIDWTMPEQWISRLLQINS